MASISLPRIPDAGRDLEDYVAGLFQAAGYYVEKNIRRRDPAEVLELDAVATSYDGPLPSAVIAEAKGGRWGFPDIFKVAGWMAYLGIGRGGFFVKESTSAQDLDRIRSTVADLGVSLVDLGDFDDPAERLLKGGFHRLCDPRLLEVWRLSYLVERTLLDQVRRDRRAFPERKGPQTLLLYHDLINDHVFFLKDFAERLERLYGAYKQHPKLSAAVASEIGGGVFAPQGGKDLPRDNPLLAEALYQGKHGPVQAAFYIEHRARVAILKAAIDLCCFAGSGRLRDRERASLVFSALPATFRDGLEVLRDRPSFRRYALLWQVFLWGFGGFYLADREDEELGWLAEQTGIPRAEVLAGLHAFDDLFPMAKGSWLVPVKDSPIRLTRMVPLAFRGVGAIQRLRRYGQRNYDRLGVGRAGRRHLITWHNGLVRMLAEVKPKPPAK